MQKKTERRWRMENNGTVTEYCFLRQQETDSFSCRERDAAGREIFAVLEDMGTDHAANEAFAAAFAASGTSPRMLRELFEENLL